MIALLDDMAVLHYQDGIRTADGGQTMGHDKGRAALHHLVKGSGDF